MSNVAIIGAGQIGSRHLQGVCQSKDVNAIWVFDPMLASLKTAEQRVQEVSDHCVIRAIKYVSDLKELAGLHFDVAIFATSANVRAESIRKFFEAASCAHAVLEKFLFCDKQDYASIGSLIESKKVTAWVNCPRRSYDFYRDFGEKIAKECDPFTLIVSGGEWGLACNSIHFLDLFSFLAKDQKVTIQSGTFDETILPSKRPGFYELTGTIIASSKRGDKALLHSTHGIKCPLTVTLQTSSETYVISESQGLCYTLKEPATTKFVMPFQSQLSGKFISSLIKTNDCMLVRYGKSAELHLELFAKFYEMFKSKNLAANNICPIT